MRKKRKTHANQCAEKDINRRRQSSQGALSVKKGSPLDTLDEEPSFDWAPTTAE